MEPSTRRRRGPVVAAIAATLVVGGAVAATRVAGDADPPHGTTGAAAPVAPPKGYLGFRLTLRAGEIAVGAGVGSHGEQAVSIRTARGIVDLTTQGALEHASWRIDPAAVHVTVRGHEGFYAGGFAAVYPHFDAAEGTPSPGATSPPPAPEDNPRQPGLRTLAWQSGSGRWAVLRTQARTVTEGDLLRLADGVDFTGRTPVRLAIAMTRTPHNLVFTGWDAQYVAGRELNSVTAIHFRVAASTEDVTVELDRGTIPAAARQLAFTVHRHRAYTAPGYGAVLFVQQARGFYLQVSAVYPSDGSSYRPETLEPIAALVSVTEQPGHPGRWYDAANALPPG